MSFTENYLTKAQFDIPIFKLIPIK